jgi:dihydroorotate dehydrogenase
MFQLAQSFYPLVLQVSRANPEAGHGFLLKLLQCLDSHRYDFPAKQIIEQCDRDFCLSDPRLSQSLWGLDFPNPVGLAAGCDKDGIAAGIWQHLGFGLAELGAITLYGQAGNPRPRLFRLPLDNAALNRLGANNLGAQITAQTLAQVWQRQPRQIPIGINLVKSKVTPLEQAAQDYLGSFRLLKDWADYFVVNVSSPNTPGLRLLQDKEQLTQIFSVLQAENQGQKPLLIKIAPDLEWEAIAVIIELAQRFELAGIIATNTTIRREGLNTEILAATGMSITEEAGGISGQPIRKRSTEIIRFIYQNTGGKLPIIGVGGIFTAEDAWEKITAGATLLQLYTGWIYRGPWLVKEILAGLLEKLEKEGFSNIKEATGLDHRLPSSPT